MRLRRWLTLVGIAGATAILLAGLSMRSQKAGIASSDHPIALLAPEFLGVNSAEAAAPGLAASLDNEAGIAAYFHSATPIVLSSVQGQFRTIETQTATYIIGSIGVPNYAITEDVHVYVDTSGWVLAYYPKTAPASQVLDWKSYSGTTISTNKLRNVLLVVAGAAGVSFPGASYYDFRYPNATNLLLIAKRSDGCDDFATFTLNLPSAYAYNEFSWSMNVPGNSGYMQVDGVDTPHLSGTLAYGSLSSAQFYPDFTHTVGVKSAYCGQNDGGLAIVYRVP